MGSSGPRHGPPSNSGAFTVHTPTLRYHELAVREGAMEIARLSLCDYADDLVALVESLDRPPLLVGYSLGGLVVQLVASRARHIGMIAACPSAVGPAGLNRTTLGISVGHALKPRPWAKPVHPPTWERFWPAVAGKQSEQVARELFDGLVCESGRVLFFELAIPWLDRTRAAQVDFSAVAGPVLLIGGGSDRIVPGRLARRTAARYRNATYVEIPESDDMVFLWGSFARYHTTHRRMDRPQQRALSHRTLSPPTRRTWSPRPQHRVVELTP
ncbi:MAG: alpha/beta fold hydrolase [Mycobacterium sp.]